MRRISKITGIVMVMGAAVLGIGAQSENVESPGIAELKKKLSEARTQIEVLKASNKRMRSQLRQERSDVDALVLTMRTLESQLRSYSMNYSVMLRTIQKAAHYANPENASTPFPPPPKPDSDSSEAGWAYSPPDPETSEDVCRSLGSILHMIDAEPMGQPIGHAWLSSPYGNRKHPISGRWGMHDGVDYAAQSGTRVYAAAPGVVTTSGRVSGYGNTAILEHSNGTETLYAHMNSVKVREGQNLERGDVIGRVGNSGYSTGPHLHFEVRVDGSPVDPEPYIERGQKVSESLDNSLRDLSDN